jgi:molecular chaperone IbpA
MRTLDLSPVFRSSVGFDRMARMLDAAQRGVEPSSQPTYPPYNIEKVSDDVYRISMAVAGFGEGDLSITKTAGTLSISGSISGSNSNQEAPADTPEAEAAKPTYLHRGIAERTFERRFQLADFIEVKAAELVNGLLHVDLVREVPEEKKPRQIPINGSTAAISAKAA